MGDDEIRDAAHSSQNIDEMNNYKYSIDIIWKY